jgi:hypothetical protein
MYDLVARSLEARGLSYQAYVDGMFAEKYNKPETPGFDWHPELQDTFDFKQLLVTPKVYTMATYVDAYSHGPTKHSDSVEVKGDNIPSMKHEFNIDEAQIRLQMALVTKFDGAFPQAVQESVEQLLFDNTDKLIGGNYNSLKYQRHQAVSKGKFDIVAENNPQGVKGISIDFNVPGGNRASKVWFDASGKPVDGANPLNDLREQVKYIRQVKLAGVDHVEVNSVTWDKVTAMPIVRQTIGYAKNSLAGSDGAAQAIGNAVMEDEMVTLVGKYIGAKVKVIDSISVVEKWDEKARKVTTPSMQSFEEWTFVFVPSERIGRIYAVRPIVIGNGISSRVALYDGGRTVLMQTFDSYEKVQKISSELNALCVPEVVTQMYYLTVKAKK